MDKLIKNFGIGVDIENIDKFRQRIADKEFSFLEKIFTKKEIKYCFTKKDPAPHFAARYAGKEAVVKAINSSGSFKIGALDYNKIEIYNEKSGEPRVRLIGMNSNNLAINISLSHCDDKAIAFVIVN